MAWEARSGLKLFPYKRLQAVWWVGMAWEARSGLKQAFRASQHVRMFWVGMAWEARSGLKQQCRIWMNSIQICRNGLGSPFGIETYSTTVGTRMCPSRNGLGSPFKGS